MGLFGDWVRSFTSYDETQEQPEEQPEQTHRVYVNQSNSTIGIKSVKSIVVGQIGGTINNYPKGQPEATKDKGKTPENSRAIGVVGWKDYGL